MPRTIPATIKVANPVTADHAELRRSLLPGMIEVLARNERQRRADLAAFEIGAVHEWGDGAPQEADWLGILLAGQTRAQSWVEPARAASVEDAKGLIEAWPRASTSAASRIAPQSHVAGVEHPGRTAEVMLWSGSEDRSRSGESARSIRAC